jgi:hypothetical protein
VAAWDKRGASYCAPRRSRDQRVVTVSTDKLIVALADWDAAAKGVCSNSSALVEAYFERALAIARQQQAKS